MLEIVLKDLKLMFRERTFVSIVFLLVFVASISSVITFGLIMLYNPEYLGYEGKAKVAVVGECSLGDCYDEKTAMELFREGKVDAVLIFSETGRMKYVDVVVPDDEIKAMQVLTYVKKLLVKYEEELRSKLGVPNLQIKAYYNGREIKVPSGSSTVFKFIYLILIPLLSVTTAVVAAGMTIDSVCEEIQMGSLEVLLSTPLSPFRISIAKVLSPVIFSAGLIILWLSLLSLNGVEIHDPVAAFLISLSITAFFIAAGYIMAAKLKDRERTQLFFSIITAGALPLMVTKAASPAVMVGRAAAGSTFNVPIAAGFAFVSFVILAISPFIARMDR
ncbi:ABC transporter permease family protein [Archaeoglobus neptunius]|uniref:ABC transporter permease n=1 Tax=Archaeoglobus neptunius TaxID=2798580 RepID=UPI00192650E5|nr:ABC transporter permease [Archaeoglobus neptunius]